MIFNTRRRFITGICLFISLFSSTTISASSKLESELVALPLRSLNFNLSNVDIQKIKNVFEAVRKFGEEQNFAVRIAQTEPDMHYIAELWRHDLHIIVTNPFTPSGFSFALYLTFPHSVQNQLLDEVVDAFRSAISQLPNIKWVPAR
ncbi:hypothetical protein [Microvirga brassicacearum]|uniref:Uncharacterized protein n=1 Tax=Microvirga brassicacearum TaxID=2580413 RepID=A0A5N3P5H0_9HYPH|nr:hypothetical protein [Microvirga brassicacearum]KAB0264980.1 hypothetical protein FEZ63_20630 [Microvirga brassicacearum]